MSLGLIAASGDRLCLRGAKRLFLEDSMRCIGMKSLLSVSRFSAFCCQADIDALSSQGVRVQ